MSRGISISGLSVEEWRAFKALRSDLQSHRAEHGTDPKMKGAAELVIFRAGLDHISGMRGDKPETEMPKSILVEFEQEHEIKMDYGVETTTNTE